MNSEIVPFAFQGAEVRTVVIDGEPWFVARDVTAVLGIVNSRDAIGGLDVDGVGTTDLIDTMGRQQSARVVSESGMYELIFQSRRPEAKQFRRWVTSDVLPAIRKTGSYSAETSEQLLARALTVATGVLAHKDEQIEALTPRAKAWDELASAQGDYDVAEAAKILARAGVVTGPQRLFDQLHTLGWLFRAPGTGKWEPYASQVSLGYLTAKPQSHFHPRTGVRLLDPPQVRVTLKGIERLRRALQPATLTAVNA
jgi:anti-repressor protein